MPLLLLCHDDEVAFFRSDVKGETVARANLSCSHRPRTIRISQARKRHAYILSPPNLEQDAKSHGLPVNSSTEIPRRSPGRAPRRHPPEVMLHTYLLRPGAD